MLLIVINVIITPAVAICCCSLLWLLSVKVYRTMFRAVFSIAEK